MCSAGCLRAVQNRVNPGAHVRALEPLLDSGAGRGPRPVSKIQLPAVVPEVWPDLQLRPGQDKVPPAVQLPLLQAEVWPAVQPRAVQDEVRLNLGDGTGTGRRAVPVPVLPLPPNGRCASAPDVELLTLSMPALTPRRKPNTSRGSLV